MASLPRTGGLVAKSALAQAFLSGKPMGAKITNFLNLVDIAETQAAQIATTTSRAQFTSKLGGRAYAPPRVTRPTTQGHFANHIKWSTYNNQVYLDLTGLENVAPYWAIQEVGTKGSAHIVNSELGPMSINVRSQVGRRINSGLVWASGLNQQATLNVGSGSPLATAAHGTEQLFLRRDVLANNILKRRMRIGKEIVGKHYLAAGANAGWTNFRQEMKAAFRQAFGKP